MLALDPAPQRRDLDARPARRRLRRRTAASSRRSAQPLRPCWRRNTRSAPAAQFATPAASPSPRSICSRAAVITAWRSAPPHPSSCSDCAAVWIGPQRQPPLPPASSCPTRTIDRQWNSLSDVRTTLVRQMSTLGCAPSQAVTRSPSASRSRLFVAEKTLTRFVAELRLDSSVVVSVNSL